MRAILFWIFIRVRLRLQKGFDLPGVRGAAGEHGGDESNDQESDPSDLDLQVHLS